MVLHTGPDYTGSGKGWLYENAGAMLVALQATGEQIVLGCSVMSVPSL